MDFKFKKLDLTEAQFAEGTARKPSTMIPVGNHDVKILDAKFVKMNDNDPTWAQFKLLLTTTGTKVGTREKDGKELQVALDKDGKEAPSKTVTLMVPTQTVRFNKPGISDRGALFPFQGFRKFMAALGEAIICDPKVLSQVLPKYFKNPDALVGETLNITIGYNKPHLLKVGEVFKIVDREDKPIIDAEYPDRDSANADAATREIALQDFPDILEYHAKVKTEKEETEEDVYDPFA